MKKGNLLNISIITAIYVVLCLVLEPLSFGVIQFRISEILCLLSIEFPYAIFANSLGCLIANSILGGLGIIDVIVGTLSTFIACYLAYIFRNRSFRNYPILSGLMIVIVNGILIGIELGFIYNNVATIPLTILQISVSEFIVIMVVGMPIYNKLIEIVKRSQK